MYTRPYEELVLAWQAVAATGQATLEEYRVGSPSRLMLSLRIGADRPLQVCIAAGVHGDEPATPWALLQAMTDGLLDTAIGYRLWCCTNPSGYDLGTRANREGVDINRSFADHPTSAEAEVILRICAGEVYDLVIDLHEDFEADGFYLYEPVVDMPALIGKTIVQGVLDAGYSLQTFDKEFDIGYPIEGADQLRAIDVGLVLPDIERECAFFRQGLPFTMYALQSGFAKRSVTIESPRRFAWDDRIALHRLALVHALAQLRRLHHAS